MPAKKKYETTHNKRAGIFYGPATGHPIIWNNDWNSLIQKEVLARDNFSRNFVAGKISAPVPVYKDISINEANWNYLLKSTYMDLGKWGSSTFRQSVPHVVGKKEAENPSVPPTGAPSEVMSEYAYRHVRSVCVRVRGHVRVRARARNSSFLLSGVCRCAGWPCFGLWGAFFPDRPAVVNTVRRHDTN